MTRQEALGIFVDFNLIPRNEGDSFILPKEVNEARLVLKSENIDWQTLGSCAAALVNDKLVVEINRKKEN